MANYKSAYTGAEIDAGIEKANTAVQDVSDKQDKLVSGTNIKTINNTSLLGSGNINIQGGNSNVWIGTQQEYEIGISGGIITPDMICIITDNSAEPTIIQEDNNLYIYSGVTITQNNNELVIGG